MKSREEPKGGHLRLPAQAWREGINPPDLKRACFYFFCLRLVPRAGVAVIRGFFRPVLSGASASPMSPLTDV